ncbi:MAG: tape measure protein [Methylobacter sp.]|uniref:tape measure protein n=1 Tax=Methylobacter sp. TaxID=2051955 RepID=UPI00258E9661|nr:tape measure protein [Methylobacter sp.]MCL7422517.1 tape measure protein [Methylobacter sp.]
MASPIVLGITIRADGSAQVRRELGGVRDGLDGAGNAARGANRQFADMARETLGLGSALKGLIAGLSVVALYQYGKEIVQVADNMKLLDGRLKVATSSQQDYIDSSKELVDISLRTGTEFDANATLFARINKAMETMGGTARDTTALTETMAQALRVSGASAGEASSVIRQMSQALASGLLRGDEFNSIMENGSRLAYALAAGLNVDIGALRAMAENGELTAAKVINAIMSQSATIDAEYKRMPLTVGAALENVKTAWGQYILQVDAGTGATASLAAQFDALANNLGPVIDTIIQLGTVAATVFAGQMLVSLGRYMSAKAAAIAMEFQHAQAILLDHQRTIGLISARLAATRADIAATQALLAGNTAMGVRMGLTNRLNILIAAQASQTAALSAATNAATAAQRGLTAAMAINPFTGLVVSLSILVGLLINAKTHLRDLASMSVDDKIAAIREQIARQKSRIETAQGPIGVLISDRQLAIEQTKLRLMKDELGRYYKEKDALKEQERQRDKLLEEQQGKLTDAQKKAAKAAETAAKKAAMDERNRREAVLKTIDALQFELQVNRLGDKEKALQTELRQHLANAVGDERDRIEALVRQIDAENQARERQAAMWRQLVDDANALVDLKNEINDFELSPDVSTDAFSVMLARIQDVGRELDLSAEQMKSLFDQLGKAYNENFIDPATDGVDELSQFAKRAAENMQDAFAEFLFDPFKEGLDGMALGFLTTMRRIIANKLSADAMEGLFGQDFMTGKQGAGIGGLLGSGLSLLGLGGKPGNAAQPGPTAGEQAIVNAVTATGNETSSMFGSVLGGLGESLLGGLENLGGGIASVFNAGITALIAMFTATSAGDSISGILSGIGSVVGVAANHGGGLVGSSGGMIRGGINPAVFIGASRYHNGGLAGNEVPSVLLKGEEVLTENDPRHRNNIGKGGANGQSANVTSIVVMDPSFVPDAMAGNAGSQVVIQHIKDNASSIRRVLEME